MKKLLLLLAVSMNALIAIPLCNAQNNPYIMIWDINTSQNINLKVTGGTPYKGQTATSPGVGGSVNAGYPYAYVLFSTLDIDVQNLAGVTLYSTTIKMVNDEKADLVFFTGDLVNDRYDEALAFKECLSSIKAPLGVYSILGNHDYGDYYQWKTEEAKLENLEKLKSLHKEFGWKLLLNEHIRIGEPGNDLAIIGIENWGALHGFSKYGNLEKAYLGSENAKLKLLLSHDPSHWNAEVTTNYKDIAATFAGHTHGFQFGFEIPGFKWSPSQWIYKQWAGLYESENQKLYVNRGLGFLFYPGRVGIAPEITVFELV